MFFFAAIPLGFSRFDHRVDRTATCAQEIRCFVTGEENRQCAFVRLDFGPHRRTSKQGAPAVKRALNCCGVARSKRAGDVAGALEVCARMRAWCRHRNDASARAILDRDSKLRSTANLLRKSRQCVASREGCRQPTLIIATSALLATLGAALKLGRPYSCARSGRTRSPLRNVSLLKARTRRLYMDSSRSSVKNAVTPRSKSDAVVYPACWGSVARSGPSVRDDVVTMRVHAAARCGHRRAAGT